MQSPREPEPADEGASRTGSADRARARARRTAAWGTLAFTACLSASLGAWGLPIPDAVLLSVLLAAVPTLSLAQLPLIGLQTIRRIPSYWSSIVTLTLLGGASWAVGTRTGGAAALGLVPLPAVPLVGWTLLMTALALGLILAFREVERRTGLGDATLLRQLVPRTAPEKRLFVVLSLAAGFGEEFAYRGYVIPVLAPILGTVGAATLSTAIFGVMHAYQGATGVLRAALMGGVLAWGFLASGSLWPSVLAHTLIDVLAGAVLGERLLAREVE